MNPRHFQQYVVRPTLLRLRPVIPWTLAAERLVLGTCIHESRLQYLDQLTPGPGPAYGVAQMEKPTYEDLWRGYIPKVPGLREALLDIAGHDAHVFPPVTELHGNLNFAVAMCRVHYRRVPKALPSADDASALCAYWKRYYNTAAGKGTVEEALPAFELAVAIATGESP